MSTWTGSQDKRPPSLLIADATERGSGWFGMAFTLGAHGVVPLGFLLLTHALGGLPSMPAPRPEPEPEVIHATLVKLGKPPDPKALPDRQVPEMPTAPAVPSPVPSHEQPPLHKPLDASVPPPPDVKPDDLSRIGDRARAFAEIAAKREREGDPDGVPEGTSDRATGDLYAGKLKSFFNRGWSVPNLVDKNELGQLVVTVDVVIRADGKIAASSVRKTSGNSLFDQSALENLARIREGDMGIPEPPADMATKYLGRTLTLRFKGSEAR